MWLLVCHHACKSHTGREPCKDATQRSALLLMTTPGPLWRDGSGDRRPLWVSPNGPGPFYCWQRDRPLLPPLAKWSYANGMYANGLCALWPTASMGYMTKYARAARPFFPPEVALYLVKLACERPDVVGRSLSQWDSAELARQLVHEGVVASISPQTVQRILAHHKLKPWRHHLWLSPTVPRDAAFAAQVTEISSLYTRPLGVWEMVLCVDEKTSLQPRTRKAPTLAAQPGRPVRVEHEYARKGALNLFAGFDTRTGTVYATTAERKRQLEFLTFLEHVDREIAPRITTIHVVLDNVRMHKGKQVQAWLAKHPRFVFHFPPVHCSWMNQVEQWFSILQRKRLRIADFADKKHLSQRLMAFVAEWNEQAHPFQWSTKSVAKVMAKCESPMAKAA